ncbi:hypothetical protein EBR43_13815 [bacterium]|nr:hypothetical protein [bacterium]
MSNMTPFEIRLELLKLSKDMLSEDYFAKRSVSENNWQTACENARQRGEPLPLQPDLPAYPHEEDVIKKANMLNGFVSQIPSAEKPIRQ